MDKAKIPDIRISAEQTAKISARLIRYQAMLALLQGEEADSDSELYTAASRLLAFRYGLGKDSIFL